MTYRSFDDLVESFDRFSERSSLVIRPFLKTERLSYGDLQKRAYQTARFLLSNNIEVGERIMIMANNSPQWVELFLGAQLIGAIIVPVDANAPSATVQQFAKQTEPKLIFKDHHLLTDIDILSTTYIISELESYIASFPISKPTASPKGDYAALIVFTSGTTADPKGVLLTQRNVLANIEGIHEAIEIDPAWRLLSVLPLSHMYELTGSLAVLSRGCSIHYMPRVSPQAIARALQDYKITAMLAIPQLLILLMERIEQTAANEGKARILNQALFIASKLPFSLRRLLFRSVHKQLGGCLDLVVTGGAPIPQPVATKWERMGVRMVQGYGLTETSPILTVNGLTNRRLDSPGYKLKNVQLRIANSGEIQAKGPSVFSQYWHDSQSTRAAFTEDDWFKTGDIGKLKNGWLFVQGRLKFIIVLSSGLKVFPEDVELVAAKHPAFQEICIVGNNQANGEVVQAVIISKKSDHAVTEAIAEINDQLPSFQHIANWRRWPDSDFPRTRLLKIDRKKVQQWSNNASLDKETEALGTHTNQDSLLRIIRLSLGDPKAIVGETDRLADIGLDSLRRLNLVALIEEQLGLAIPEENVTQSTTVAKLRQLIAHGDHTNQREHRAEWHYKLWPRFLGNGLREIVIRGVLRIWVKIDVEGRDNLNNLKLPAIFIFNHVDDFEAPVIYQALPYYIRKNLAAAVANDVMREHKPLRLIARLCFAGFNFARKEPYMPSLEYTCQMLDRGWNIFLSPEGRISTTGKLQPFKAGIGLLAVESGAPIVPVKTFNLAGTVPLHAKWPRKHSRATVRIGAPLSFSKEDNYDEATEKLQKIMESL